MKAQKAQQRSANAKRTAPAADHAATATSAVLGYVENRTVQHTADSAAFAELLKRFEESQTRIQELEAALAAVTKLSEDLKAALYEAQLGFRRHVRQHVDGSELQIALKLFYADAQSATDTPPAPQVETPVADNQSASEPLAGATTAAGSQGSGQPNGASGDKKKRNNHRHGRRGDIPVLPKVFIDIIPPQVQLEGLNKFEQMGSEDSTLIGYRRGGPIQLVLRRLKYVPLRSARSQDDATQQADGTQAAPSATQPSDAAAQDSTASQPGASEPTTDCAEPEVASAPVNQSNTVACATVQSSVLSVPLDTGFKRSPFVDGALVWYVPEPVEFEPEERVLIAPLPERPIDRGMADASLIAHVLCHKLDYHTPYYRQQTELERLNLPIARANLCRWHFECGELAEPIARAMWQEALARSWFAMDATSTAIFDRPRYRKGQVFVLVAPGDSVLFRYSDHYDGETVNKLFGDSNATILADASSCHNLVFGPGRRRGAGCWSHARKPWYKAFQAGERELSAVPLHYIRELFRIEDEAALLSSQDRLRLRAEKSAPIVKAFFEYVERYASRAGPETLARLGFVYAQNQKEMLCQFLSNGDLPISNNESERALRRIVKGRMNWLSMRSSEHAEHTCALYSLVASCQLHGLDPEFYLQEILTVAPSWPVARVLELSPKYWIATRQKLLRDGLLRYIDLAAITGSQLRFRTA